MRFLISCPTPSDQFFAHLDVNTTTGTQQVTIIHLYDKNSNYEIQDKIFEEEQSDMRGSRGRTVRRREIEI